MQGVQATAKAIPAMTGPPVPARRSSASDRNDWFSSGTNGLIRKITPIVISSTPATMSIVLRAPASGAPSPVANSPSATKTKMKLRQKSAAGPRIAPRWRSPTGRTLSPPVRTER